MKVPLFEGKNRCFIAPQRILCFKGEGKKTFVYIIDKREEQGFRVFSSSKGLAFYKRCPACTNFMQVNKQMLINLDYIKEYIHSERQVTLDIDLGFLIALTKDYRKAFWQMWEPGPVAAD